VAATPSFTSVLLSWRPPPNDGGSPILAFQAECDPAASAALHSTDPDLEHPNLKHPDLKHPNLQHSDLNLLHPDLLHPDLVYPDLLQPDLLAPNASAARRAAVGPRVLAAAVRPTPDFKGGGLALPGFALRDADTSALAPPAGCTVGGSNASSCTAPGAAAGSTYSCRVRALNSVGPSAWSYPVEICTLPATVPGAPGVLSASASDALVLRWGQAAERGAPVLAYQLQARDWWAPSFGWVTISNGSQPELDTRDLPLSEPLYKLRLLPAVPYPLRVRALSRLGPSLWGPTFNLTLPQRGGCGMSDELAFRDTPAATKAGIQSGLVNCVAAADREVCAQRRIQHRVGLSAPCAACWVQEGLCSLKRCVLQCLQPASAVCARCSKDNCFPACVLCSGMPEWAFPP
jgi:hypothetical protein